MFFGDPVAAFRNFHRALKPTGRLVFVCWRTPQENPWGLVPLSAARPFLPPLPRPGPEDPGQFSFGDRARVERILKESGFGQPDIRPIDRPVSLGKDMAEILDNAGRFGPLARAFADAGGAIERPRPPSPRPRTASWAGGRDAAGACWLVSAAAH
jgi:SAM-dependent methyltransferase